ncbi:MAG: hypothetical protein OXG15_02545 [Gammaproteobacteria bacterium]|nr:hypothetical protein [Gammaproteobacteria bacterium]
MSESAILIFGKKREGTTINEFKAQWLRTQSRLNSKFHQGKRKCVVNFFSGPAGKGAVGEELQFGEMPMFDFFVRLTGDLESLDADVQEDAHGIAAEILAAEMGVLSETDLKVMFTGVEQFVTADYDYNPAPFIRFA